MLAAASNRQTKGRKKLEKKKGKEYSAMCKSLF